MGPASVSRQMARLAGYYRRQGGVALLGKLARRLCSPAGRAYRRHKTAEDSRFDAVHGYDTGGIQHIDGLSLIGPHGASGMNHVACPPDDIARAIAAIDLPLAETTFVDLGSGKGRAVLIAADHPFRRLIGIEFAAELHAAAQANLATRARRVGPDARITLIHGDAAAFDLPAGPVVLFLFNPFGPPVLDMVARRALAAWRDRPRPLRILYLNPVYPDAVTDAGWRRLASGDGLALFAPEATG